MAIGRDVYVDSRMIIQRLDQLFPDTPGHPALSSKETAGLAALLNKFTIDASVFSRGVQIMPPEAPAVGDAAFIKDRAGFYGKNWSIHDALKRRPESLAHVRQCFDIAESLFADGRQWVAATEKPTLADLEGVWSFSWITTDLQPPAKYFSERLCPKVYSWRDRFLAAVSAAKDQAPKPLSLKGEDAVRCILGSELSEHDPLVDGNDPLQFERGETVPTDGGGFTHKDRGKLVKLTKDEVAIAVKTKTGETVHIHAPRWNFRIQPVEGASKL